MHGPQPPVRVAAACSADQSVDELRERIADERPLLERRAGRSSAMRSASVRKPVTPMTRNVPRITASSGLVLMRMRYGRCDVAAHDRPADADQEHDAREVGAERSTPGTCGRAGTSAIRAAGGRSRSMTVAMNSDDEPEVDARVHDARGGVAQQRLHPHAGAEVREPALGVLPASCAGRRAGPARSCGRAATRATRRRTASSRPRRRTRPSARSGRRRRPRARSVESSCQSRDRGHEPDASVTSATQRRRRRGRADAAAAVRTGRNLRRAEAREPGRRGYCTDFARRLRGGACAMPASSLRAKPGTSSMRPANSRWPSTTSSMSVSATTVALRGAFSSSASSPNASPGPRVATLRPVAGHPGLPVEDHEELVAGLALGDERPCPARTCTSSARRATSWRSLREQAAKSGTCWRWSMKASRRAMGRESNDSRRSCRGIGPARTGRPVRAKVDP